MNKIISTPLARALASKMGIDITQVKGSGPFGRILKEDVANFKESPVLENKVVEQKTSQTTTSSLDGKREKVTPIRKAIAKAMINSRDSVAYFSLVNEIDMTKL